MNWPRGAGSSTKSGGPGRRGDTEDRVPNLDRYAVRVVEPGTTLTDVTQTEWRYWDVTQTILTREHVSVAC